MAREVISAFEVNPDKVHRIPNGIDPEWWATGEHPDGRAAPLVLTWGRVQFEKGFQVLARAMTPAAVAGARASSASSPAAAATCPSCSRGSTSRA